MKKMSIIIILMISMLGILLIHAQDEAWTVVSFEDEQGIPMVFVPEGTFSMGINLDDEVRACQERVQTDETDDCSSTFFLQDTPTHDVQIDDFWIDKFEVTFAQYRACVADGICASDTLDSLEAQAFDTSDTLPVFAVTFEDAEEICTWRMARLPSEAEWEYAARGSMDYIYPWGNDFVGANTNICDESCEFNRLDLTPPWDDGFTYTAPVGSFEEDISWVGAYDMLGNVAEWTNSLFEVYEGFEFDDDYLEQYLGNPVFRGASYITPHSLVTTTYRFGSATSDYSDLWLGFRCARDASTMPLQTTR
ncbi:MAG: SUMF1/EgtB/PvdO family nonheme iron enzyme [Aggregatilineales bacterium]